jgi:hypothetical protein
MRLQHAKAEDAVDYGCVCYRAPDGTAPPGKQPYCSTRDFSVARRWFSGEFDEIECEGEGCILRQDHFDSRERRFRPAKSRFVLVGLIDEPGFEKLLVSVVTSSDYNVAQWLGLVRGVETEWKAIQETTKTEVPFSWYGIPIELTVYQSTGDKSRFPRIHFARAFNVQEMFGLLAAYYSQVKAIGSGQAPVALLPAAELASGHEALDQEVLDPIPREPRRSSRARVEAALNRPQAQAQDAEFEMVDPGEAFGRLQKGDVAGFNAVLASIRNMPAEDRGKFADAQAAAKARVFQV